MIVTKPNGTKVELTVNQTMNAGQIEWFKAGSGTFYFYFILFFLCK